MRALLVIAFMASSIAVVVLWPDPLPPRPQPVQPGPEMTHVQAVSVNAQQVEKYERLEREHFLRIGGAILAVTLILTAGYKLGRHIK
jgi:hypothetical protein